MEKLTYAQFRDESEGRSLALLLARFFEPDGRQVLLDAFAAPNTGPIPARNSGKAVFRSSGFYRELADGNKSYWERKAGDEFYKKVDSGETFLLIIGVSNAIVYRVES